MPDPTSTPDPTTWWDKMKYMVEALRSNNPQGHVPGQGATTGTPTDAQRFPLAKQLEGYRLHVQEAKAMGEEPMAYEDWIKQQPSLSAPQE